MLQHVLHADDAFLSMAGAPLIGLPSTIDEFSAINLRRMRAEGKFKTPYSSPADLPGHNVSGRRQFAVVVPFSVLIHFSI